MKAPAIARVIGALFLLAGVAAVLPFVTTPAGPSDEYLQLGAGYGFVAGIFAVNAVHDVVHAIVGVWGILASFSFAAAVRYCRWTAWIFGALALLGLIPITDTVFGVVPLYGYDVILHAVVAVLALYGGYGAGRLAAAHEDALPPPAAPA
ncbi:MAG TPA: DUF4383 domain-containing protein [Candidatus Acidoferrales bacterium]|nr:DUF4383 domain-containing protein [Candidatus Acidoferrales bacterium]